jgi:FkbM family methyltransferase
MTPRKAQAKTSRGSRSAVVIAADKGYFQYALNLIGSVQTNSDIFDVIFVYDLGLTRSQRRLLEGVSKVEVRDVQPFVSHWRQCWSWKPWVWADAPAETVLYLDAGLTVLRSLSPIMEQIDELGYFVVSEDVEVGLTIPSDFYRLYAIPKNIDKRDCIAGGVIGFRRDTNFYENVVVPTLEDVRLGRNLGWSEGESKWRNTGINRLDDPPMRDCEIFRHDQTLLNIHFYKKIKDPRVTPIDRFSWRSPYAHPAQLIWHHRRASEDFPYLPQVCFRQGVQGEQSQKLLRSLGRRKYLIPKKYMKKARHLGGAAYWRVLQRYGPGVQTVRYKGFDVAFSRGTSLIDRIRWTGEYEPEATGAIIAALRERDGKIFVDVGANIGLISLGVLSELPNLKIYAFEPGPHQRELFARTIHENHLEHAIILSSDALGESAGTATFYTHDTKHVSGDGFVDTGRAGETREVLEVSVSTLDRWWRRMKRPEVAVLKLDIEGAELLALRGGQELIRSCQPTIFIEIHPKNLENYPYSANDVAAFLRDLGYKLLNYEGEEATVKNGLLMRETDFIARPRD